MRALPLPNPAARAGRAPESGLLTTILAIGFMAGMAWAFLPSGLEFDVTARAAREDTGEGSGTFALQWMPLIMLGLIGVAYRFRAAVLMVRELNPWTLLIPAWAMFSMLWAPEPFTVFKQSFGIAGVSVLALGFALYGWHPDRFVTVLRPLITAALVLSLLVGLLIPEIGVHQEQQFELQGSWRGITYQKNGLGQLAATGIILWFHAWASRTASVPVAGAGLLISLLMMLLSRSSTSLLLSIICCGVILLQLRPPLRLGSKGSIVVTAGWLMILAPVFIYLISFGSLGGEGVAETFASLFGKDASFSGRTYIWAEVIHNIGLHPWLGVGYNSFWHTPLADETIRRLGWPCPSGHNGYLDLWNTLGLPGMVLLLMMLVRQFADLSLLSKIDRQRAALHFGLLLYSVLANLTESGWFLPMAYTHIVVIYSSVCVSRLLFDARLLQAAAAAAATPRRALP